MDKKIGGRLDASSPEMLFASSSASFDNKMKIQIKKYFTDVLLDWIGGQRQLVMQIDITNKCNLHCLHCYQENHSADDLLGLEEWLHILNEFGELCRKLWQKPALTICGGEPLMCSFLKPLILEIRKKWPDARVTVLSNGTMVVKERGLDFFKKNDVKFQISLDGATADTNDFIRGRGSFDAACSGVESLRKECIDVFIQTTLSRRTHSQIEELFCLAKKLCVQGMNFTRLISQGRAQKLVDFGNDGVLGPAELKNAYEQIVLNSKRYQINTNTHQPLFVLIDQGLGMHDKFGFQGVIVDHAGNLKVSSRSPYILGNIIESGLKNLFLDHQMMRSLRKGKIRKCGDCTYYRKCGGSRNAAFAQSGSFFEPDPGCWI